MNPICSECEREIKPERCCGICNPDPKPIGYPCSMCNAIFCGSCYKLLFDCFLKQELVYDEDTGWPTPTYTESVQACYKCVSNPSIAYVSTDILKIVEMMDQYDRKKFAYGWK